MSDELPTGYRPQVTDKRGKWVGCGGGMATEDEAADWALRCAEPDGEWRVIRLTQAVVRSGKRSYGEED